MIEQYFPNGIGHYLAGGLMIGAAVGLLFITTGLKSGVSTVFSSTWSFVSKIPFFNRRVLQKVAYGDYRFLPD